MRSPLNWRQRLVETFHFEAAGTVRTESSIQAELPLALREKFELPNSGRIRALVPIASRPKMPLFEFDVTGSNCGPAFVLPRASIAAIETDYFNWLASELDVISFSGLDPDFLNAMFASQASRFDYHMHEAQPWSVRKYDAARASLGLPNVSRALDEKTLREALSAYVERAFRLQHAAGLSAYWFKNLEVVRAHLPRAIEAQPSFRSTTENPLIALPEMPLETVKSGDITRWLNSYATAVKSAVDDGHSELLEVLATYGRRWELIVDTEIPVSEPFELKVTEERLLGLQPRRVSRRDLRSPSKMWSASARAVDQDVAMKEALSTHVHVIARDPALRIVDSGWQVDMLDGSQTGAFLAELAQDTSDTIAWYSSEEKRPRIGSMRITFRSTWSHSVATLVAIFVLAATVLWALNASNDGKDLAGRLTVVFIPASVIGAIAFLRHRTALANRLFGWRRFVIGGLLVIAWLVALIRLARS